MSQDIINIDYNPPPACAANWIGKGLKWTWSLDTVPAELGQLYNHRVEIPPEYNVDSLYDRDQSVSAFVKHKFRPQYTALVHPNHSSCFSDNAPTTTPNTDNNAPFPPSKTLQIMKDWSRQALLDGARSINHPITKERYDLWVLTYWLKLQDVLLLQKRWKEGCRWLAQRPRDPVAGTAFEAAVQLLAKLPCDADTSAFQTRGARTADLVRLLSNNWIDDEIMNLLLGHLGQRVRAAPALSRKIVLGDRAFVLELCRAKSAAVYDGASPPLMRRVEMELGPSPKGFLYFPVFLREERHWVAVRVNFLRREVSYGTYLSFTSPQRWYSSVLKATHWESGCPGLSLLWRGCCGGYLSASLGSSDSRRQDVR